MEGWFGLFKLAIVLLCIFVPLGIWKLVEIIAWLCENVTVTIGN
jgi:hypothetical protein